MLTFQQLKMFFPALVKVILQQPRSALLVMTRHCACLAVSDQGH